jgi:hypothetical protein
MKSLEEFAEKRARGHANSQFPERKRAKLDARLAGFDAGGVRNIWLAERSGPMRAEALRLCRVLRAAGLEYPVWPFVEAP